MASSLASGGVERGVYIWRMQDGAYTAVPFNDPAATPCGINVPIVATPPPGAAGTKPWAVAHTHPSTDGDFVPSICGFPPSSTFEPSLWGGGSGADWYYARTEAVSVYAITKTGDLYRLDLNGQPTLKMKNPNAWKTTAMGCFSKMFM